MSHEISRAEANLRKAERLEYIRSLLGEMRTMAAADNERMLAYLIEMAYVEASDMLRERNQRNAGLPAMVA
jgi:hypothetical protein